MYGNFVMRRAVRTGVLLCGMAALGGCASLGSLLGGTPGAPATIVDAAALPAPSGIDATALDRPYHVGPYDALEIDVFGVADLSHKQVQADASGHVPFPLIGLVDAAGMTLDELGTTIAARLQDKFIRDPQVSVNLVQAVSQTVTIEGAVNAPGIYPVVGRMTLIKAIAVAKGAAKFSRLNRATILRTVDDQTMAAVYDVIAVHRGYYPDPEIFPGDTIVVGDAQTRKLFKGVAKSVPSPGAPLVVSFKAK
ncbi:polysaccharide biosynthesis/export family protein [soil metagenome]